MKCAGSRSCPFPPLLGEDRCREHFIDGQMELTLHETSGEGKARKREDVPNLEVGSLDKRSQDRLRTAHIKLSRKIRFRYIHSKPEKVVREPRGPRGRPKLTEAEKEERRRKYTNTYCKAVLENGVTCNQPIPLSERLCEACKERLLPTKKEKDDAVKL